ncbi:MAG TPA: universal stress protein [Salinivirgaceae bacterium]|nr:universal stress protein [Salinivirgaceae bacterium]
MKGNLITIATETYARALILQGFLQSKGIECILQNVNLVQPNVSDGVKVMIHEKDVEKAIRLLSTSQPLGKTEAAPAKILVPVDFTTGSINAAKFALKLAHRFSSEVKILHVFHSPTIDMIPFSDVGSIQIDFDYNNQVVQHEAKKQLLQMYEELKNFMKEQKLENARIGYSLREGFAAFGIVDVARRYKPTLIIMGTRSSGFESVELVGDVAAQVAEETKIPLLVLPENVSLSEPSNVNNILYALHLDGKDAFALRKLFSLLRGFKIKVRCIYASENPEDAIVKAKMKELQSYIHKTIKNTEITFEILHSKDAFQTFRRALVEENIDLFALTMRKRSFWVRLFNPSLTRQMLAQSDTPMLIFPV